jgi:hypothetical protein
MAINFPDAPAEDDEFTVSGTTWVYHAPKWELVPPLVTEGGGSANLDGGHPDSIYTPMLPIDAGGI